MFHSIRCLGYKFAVLKTNVIHLNMSAIDENISRLHELLYLKLYKYSIIVVPLNTYVAIIGNIRGAFTRVVARVRSRIRIKILPLKIL